MNLLAYPPQISTDPVVDDSAMAWAGQLVDTLNRLINGGIVSGNVKSGSLLGNDLNWSVGASPPASPVDGDLWLLPVDASNGVNWLFRYSSAEATYKWEFIGGASLEAEVDGAQAVNSVSYVDLGTVGPSITVPRAGDYYLSYGVGAGAPLVNGQIGNASPKLGAATAADADAIELSWPGATSGANMILAGSRIRKKTLAASDVVKLQYRSDVANSQPVFRDRWLRIDPIRVS